MDRGFRLNLGNRGASRRDVVEIQGEPLKRSRFVETEALSTVRSHNRMNFVAPAQQRFRHVRSDEPAGASYENLHLDYLWQTFQSYGICWPNGSIRSEREGSWGCVQQFATIA